MRIMINTFNKASMKALMVLTLCIIYLQGISENIYAKLPELVAIQEEQYYGKNALSMMDNAENYLFVYEQIAKGIENCDSTISVYDNTHQISKEDIAMIFEIYCNDYPQHFWRNNKYSYSYMGTTVTVFRPSYNMSGSILVEAKSKYEKSVSDVIVDIDASMSEFERELLIHDRLAEQIEYDVSASNAHNSYGAFVDGKAVCEGYARAFQDALYRVGIECQTVTGYADGDHAWNLVRIDDAYYYVDLTWDDPVGANRIYHAYFNMPLSEISRNHTLDTLISMPEAVSWEANYFNVIGTRLDSYTIDNIVAVLKKDVSADIYFTCDATNFYNWYKSNISTIVNKLGIQGGYSYGYQSAGNEYIVNLSGNRKVVNVTAVTLSETEHTFEHEGEKYQLKGSVLPVSANNATIYFSSSNTDVAIVNKYTGMITAVGAGTAEIKAVSEDGNKVAKCKVNVKAEPVTAELIIENGMNSEIKVGDEINLVVKANGGNGQYQYKYVVHNLDNDTWYCLKDKSNSNTFTCKMTTQGRKELIASVTDSQGNYVKTNAVSIIVKSDQIDGKLVIDHEKEVNVGDTLELAVSATGGSGNYTYKYVVHNLDTDAWYCLKDNTKENVYSCKVTSAGNKEFIVRITDSNGKYCKTNAVRISIKSDALEGKLRINEIENMLSVRRGDTIYLSVEANGGSGEYTYKYVVHNLDNDTWYCLKDNSLDNSYSCKITSDGNKEFVVAIKDSEGRYCKTNTVKVTAGDLQGKLLVNNTVSDSIVGIGDTISLSVTVHGGSEPYTYKYVVHNLDNDTWYCLKQNSSENTFLCKITAAGNKEFVVAVTDSDGKYLKTNSVRVTAQ